MFHEREGMETQSDKKIVNLKMRARTLNVNEMQGKTSEGMKNRVFTSEQKYFEDCKGELFPLLC